MTICDCPCNCSIAVANEGDWCECCDSGDHAPDFPDLRDEHSSVSQQGGGNGRA